MTARTKRLTDRHGRPWRDGALVRNSPGNGATFRIHVRSDGHPLIGNSVVRCDFDGCREIIASAGSGEDNETWEPPRDSKERPMCTGDWFLFRDDPFCMQVKEVRGGGRIVPSARYLSVLSKECTLLPFAGEAEDIGEEDDGWTKEQPHREDSILRHASGARIGMNSDGSWNWAPASDPGLHTTRVSSSRSEAIRLALNQPPTSAPRFKVGDRVTVYDRTSIGVITGAHNGGFYIKFPELAGSLFYGDCAIKPAEPRLVYADGQEVRAGHILEFNGEEFAVESLHAAGTGPHASCGVAYAIMQEPDEWFREETLRTRCRRVPPGKPTPAIIPETEQRRRVEQAGAGHIAAFVRIRETVRLLAAREEFCHVMFQADRVEAFGGALLLVATRDAKRTARGIMKWADVTDHAVNRWMRDTVREWDEADGRALREAGRKGDPK